MKAKFFVLLIVVLLSSGCHESKDEQLNIAVQQIENLSTENDMLKDELYTKDEEIENLNTKIIEMNEELNDKSRENTRLEEMNESLQAFDDEYIDLFGKRITTNSIYNLSQSVQLIEFKKVQPTEVNQYIIPYEESMVINVLTENDLVEVLAYVYDADFDIWVLVIDTFARGIGAPAMGFVKASNLIDIDENPITISEHTLQDISVGDSIEEVIALLGRDYELIHDDYYTAIVYDNLTIYLDRNGYYVNSVSIDLHESNEFEFDNIVYLTSDLDLVVRELEMFFERFYGNEEIARDTNMVIDFIEYSINESYTILISFDERNTITSVTIGSFGWLY